MGFVHFDLPSDAPSCFVLSGSGWCQTAGQMIGVQLELDGKVGDFRLAHRHAHRAQLSYHVRLQRSFRRGVAVLIAVRSALAIIASRARSSVG